MSKTRSRSNSNGTSWFHRKAQLRTLLGTCGDDEEEGIALDKILHGQAAIGKTQTSIDVDNARFSDKDLVSFGPLADAQFGMVELVSCRLDGRIYVRKRVSKKFALKMREQCSPQNERRILLLALKSQPRNSSSWTPHMLCAYQCSTFLNIVMEYAAGGSLWDVLESSSEGRLSASDLAWWAPQCVSAIDWLHTRAGFAHRDIKPHNFVVRPGPSARLLLIDFGSAAPLLAPRPDGVQHVPRSHCLVPCGTCDYISPEILQAHEEALVALEMSDDERDSPDDSDVEPPERMRQKAEEMILQGDFGYGREADWWSLGAMLYELAFGVAPFFANDIRQTYAKIMSHESNLTFDRKVSVPSSLISFIKGLLTHHERRLGRFSASQLKNHAYFKDVNWTNIHSRPSPPDLLLPEFTYATPLAPPEPVDDNSESSTDTSKPFAFSALFQSSVTSKPDASSFHSNQQDLLSTPAFGRRSFSRGGSSASAERSIASFIGFSWGPPKDAFDEATRIVPAEPASSEPGLCVLPEVNNEIPSPKHPLVTPKRPSRGTAPPSTVRVTSVRRSAQSRPVSDREAMRMLVNCVGQSARKRVLESGKKPKILLPQFGFGSLPPAMNSTALRDSLGKGRPRAPSYSRVSPHSSIPSAVRKELRFDETATQIMPNLSYTNTFTTTLSNSGLSTGVIPYVPPPYSASESETATETDGPPSPSPSPRPGSAMSMLSMSRRSATPTVSSAYLMGVPSRPNSEPSEVRPRSRAGSLGSTREAGGDNGTSIMEEPQPRRARFVDSPPSSPEPPKERAPLTPHPRADQVDRRDQPASRRTRFEASPPSPGRTKKSAPGTPHPLAGKKTGQTEQTPRRTRFGVESFAESPELAKKHVYSTPHPKGQARRSSKPPLQTRHSSTPARPGLTGRDITIDDLLDDDETLRPQTTRQRMDLSETESEEGNDVSSKHVNEIIPQANDSETLEETQDIVLRDSVSYNRHGSYDSDCDGLELFEDMKRRYEQLLADIANVKLHIDDFASQVRDSNQ
ncbi:kinase-like protein [Fomitiporia mediterranea MF3/22]|uniref:kinase-like protein n=1 Tax=Fomitiporia mediterranea (strain MF3/22) TaxID=694068 RepID=UPI000440774F|nr:kinase-like protein [Fomitiporia mediterranea MF3/22]EJD05220.1 kinase-like protein [Fomitiporia mediterranea MF3/22]